MDIFAKNCNLDVRLGSECASDVYYPKKKNYFSAFEHWDRYITKIDIC